MRKVTCFIVVLLICTYVSAQDSVDHLANSLHFRTGDSWSMDMRHFSGILQLDSTALYRDKYPLRIRQVPFAGIYMPLSGGLYKVFPLPSVAGDSLEISCTCKTQHLEKAYWVVSGISERETLLYSDTLSINGCEDWHTFQKNVPLIDVAMLKLHLMFEGVQSGEFIKSRGKNVDGWQNLWLDRIEMNVDGNTITNCPAPCRVSPSPLLRQHVVVADSLLSSFPGSLFGSKKIVALGESVHGSETINQSVIQLLKHGIENDDRRLLLLELPLEKSLYLNRFVQGDTCFYADSIRTYLEHTLYSDRLWMEFLYWLKEYNAQVDKKVWLLGIDHAANYQETSLDLFEYLTAVNRAKPETEITKFCRQLLKIGKFEENLSVFHAHDCFKDRLGVLESEIVSHCLSLAIQGKHRSIQYLTYRDEFMFENLSFLCNRLFRDELMKVFIYSHFEHVCRSSLDIEPSLGFLAKSTFGDDYFMVGIFVGGGETLNSSENKWTISHLQECVPGMFEYWLEQVPEDKFYVSHDFLPSRLMQYRRIGLFSQETNALMNPFYRMEGALFIRESTPLEKKTELAPDNLKFIYRFKKYLEESRKADSVRKIRL